ncbi:MAG: NifB/NifX family molybdenum-iron cluster-binding protein [Syntrophomonadales bacterium]|jgi:predicted Fe-Mo cluster-binding NifX family protein
MKIAVPVEENSMESNICQSFGRAPYFLIYDTESKENVFLDNTAVASQGGAGIKAAQTIVDSQAKALLTPRCGENAAAVITAANIKIYKTVSDSIKANIEAFTDGKLPVLDEIHAGFHNHGGR